MFSHTAPSALYTLSLHDALPICYVLRNPLILSDELGGYALVAISCLGLAYCAMERGHIRITFVVERLSPRTAGWTRLATLALGDRKSTRLNSSHGYISYAVFCLK